MEILLDTSFIISCVRQKIDFITVVNELFDQKIDFLLPREVLSEIKTISVRSGEKRVDKQAARVALDLIDISEFKLIKLNDKVVDRGITNYLLNNPKIMLATLDRGLIARSGGEALTIKGNKSIEVLSQKAL